jgi:hypothetical protein
MMQKAASYRKAGIVPLLDLFPDTNILPEGKKGTLLYQMSGRSEAE